MYVIGALCSGGNLYFKSPVVTSQMKMSLLSAVAQNFPFGAKATDVIWPACRPLNSAFGRSPSFHAGSSVSRLYYRGTPSSAPVRHQFSLAVGGVQSTALNTVPCSRLE